MSNGVFGNLGKKISTTLESAQKDLRSSFAKSLAVAANTIAAPNTGSSRNITAAGSRTKLFSTILERSQRIRDHIIDRRNPKREAEDSGDGPSVVVEGRDEVQEKLVIFARLEKEFSELIEAYEILLSERIHLEEIFTGTNQLESLDDLELVGQYYKALQDTSQISRQEIVRLTEELQKQRQHAEEATILKQKGDSPLAEDATPRLSIHENLALTPFGGGGIELHPDKEDQDASDESSTQAPTVLVQNLRKELREKEEEIMQLEESRGSLQRERTSLGHRVVEQGNLINSLESQKIALETRVNYLQRQLQDLEGVKGKLKEVSTSGKAELEQAKEETMQLRRKLELTEANHLANRKLLEAMQAELALLREEQEGEQRTLITENNRANALLKAADQMLAEERAKGDSLGEALRKANEHIDFVSTKLAEREAELLRQHRAAISADSKHHRTSSSIQSNDSNAETGSIKQKSPTSTDQAVRTLKAECEKLALENSRLKAASQFEHMRNVLLRYLQLPEQHAALLPVLASLFRFSTADLATVRK